MVLLPLRLCRGIHSGILAPAQAVDLVAQEGRVLKFQQLGSFLHLPGQAVNGGFALELAHPPGVHPGILSLVADFNRIRDGLDDGLRDDAVFSVVGHLDGAAAFCLGDGAVHAVRHLVGVHDDQTFRVAGGAADGLNQARLAA